jgi:hypothetical protein
MPAAALILYILAQLAIFFLSGFLAGKQIGRVQLRLPVANKKNR